MNNLIMDKNSVMPFVSQSKRVEIPPFEKTKRGFLRAPTFREGRAGIMPLRFADRKKLSIDFFRL